MNYNTDMSAAPKDAESVLLVVPTGDPDAPLSVELGRWDETEDEWEGEWRHIDGPQANFDPIAWAAVPTLDNELLSVVIANGGSVSPGVTGHYSPAPKSDTDDADDTAPATAEVE